jgi:hypothetical protein
MPEDALSRKLYNELLGIICRCGCKKSARQTFCRRCYFALPGELRRNLYRLIGNGYEEAYAVAVRFLKGDDKATEAV